MKKP
jgi:hypothetical protein